jgi:hypothetical protein
MPLDTRSQEEKSIVSSHSDYGCEDEVRPKSWTGGSTKNEVGTQAA